jgi:site-specific DNA-methyltransferase (adenine-specific)
MSRGNQSASCYLTLDIKTTMNDYKQDGFCLLIGDCIERLKEIPSESIDAIITDIPYGINVAEWDVLHANTNSALLGASPAQSKSLLFKSRGKPLNGWSESDKGIGQEFQDFCKLWLKESL